MTTLGSGVSAASYATTIRTMPPPARHQAIDLCFLIITSITGITSTTLNSVIIRHYLKNRHRITHQSYFMIAITDFIIGIAACLQSLCFFYIYNDLRTVPYKLLVSTYVTTFVGIKMGVFASVFTAVARSIQIVMMFRRTNHCLAVSGFITYFLFWTVIILLNVTAGKGFVVTTGNFHAPVYVPASFYSPVGLPNFIRYIISMGPKEKCALEYGYSVFFVALPVVITGVCLCCNIVFLFLKRSKKMVVSGRDYRTTSMITISLLTGVFFICNLPYLFVPSTMGRCGAEYSSQNHPLTYLLSALFSFVNSATNPIIIILRSKSLNLLPQSFRPTIQRMFTSSRGNVTTTTAFELKCGESGQYGLIHTNKTSC